MTNPNTLKPCPFCGETESISDSKNGYRVGYIQCHACFSMKEINNYMAESKIIIEGLLKFLDKKYRKEILMELLQTECGMNENSAEDVAPYVEH